MEVVVTVEQRMRAQRTSEVTRDVETKAEGGVVLQAGPWGPDGEWPAVVDSRRVASRRELPSMNARRPTSTRQRTVPYVDLGLTYGAKTNNNQRCEWKCGRSQLRIYLV